MVGRDVVVDCVSDAVAAGRVGSIVNWKGWKGRRIQMFIVPIDAVVVAPLISFKVVARIVRYCCCCQIRCSYRTILLLLIVPNDAVVVVVDCSN